MTSLAVRASVALALFLASFTVVSSVIFLYGTGLTPHFDYPFYQWWFYIACCYDVPVVHSWLLVSGLPAALIPLLIGVIVAYQTRRVRAWTLRRNLPPTSAPGRLIRARTDNHGHARWATALEIWRRWSAIDPIFGYLTVGEAYDPTTDTGDFDPRCDTTWGKGGKGSLIRDACRVGSTFSMLIAGSGSYKTVSAVSSLLTWKGSVVVLDPACELAPMLAGCDPDPQLRTIGDRQRMGHRVFVLSPHTAAVTGVNILDYIDISSPVAETDIHDVVERVCGYTPRSDKTAEFFKDMGKTLVACMIAHMMWDPEIPPDFKTLKSFRAALTVSSAELKEWLKRIHDSSPSALARGLAGDIFDVSKDAPETFGGIRASAAKDTNWLSTTAYADLVSGDSFKTKDITDGKTDVFLALPLKDLETTPAVARCIIGALLNAAYEANGQVQGRILFLLDEARRLGRMKIIEVARDAGRKYRITMHLLYQSTGQIKDQWGDEGLKAWNDSLAWRAYAAIKDPVEAEALSRACGERGVVGLSESLRRWSMFGRRSQGGTSITYSEMRKRLISADEIMYDLREDAQIVIPKVGRPMLVGRAIYFRRPEFVARVARNRFVTESDNA